MNANYLTKNKRKTKSMIVENCDNQVVVKNMLTKLVSLQ